MLDKKVTQYIDEANEEQKLILNYLRMLIHEHIDGIHEKIKWGYPTFSRTRDILYLRKNKKHVTFGIYDYHMIERFESDLEGDGKDLRHIKVHAMDKMNVELIINILETFNKLKEQL